MTDRDRLIELLKQVNFDFSEECIACCEDGYKATPMLEDFFADYLLANGVIVPPCKVGDVIYHLYPIQGIVAKKVKRIQYGSYGLMIADGNGVFHSDVIGKTVFLTKEEAENTLKHFKTL